MAITCYGNLLTVRCGLGSGKYELDTPEIHQVRVRAWWNGDPWCWDPNSTRWLPRYGSVRTMAEEIEASLEGLERLNELLTRNIDSEEHHKDPDPQANFYPVHQVDIVVQYEGRSGSRTVEGTLIEVRRSLEQDKEKREQQRYNGWFGKVRTEDGFLNVYADPDSSGPRIIFTPGWDGRGGRRYKWPIQNIVVEEKEGTDPQCFKCHDAMDFGWFRDSPEDHHGISMGWICTGCAAGYGMGRFEAHDIEEGLP